MLQNIHKILPASLVAQLVKNLLAMQKTWVQSSGCRYWTRGEGNGNPLQYSCLENPMDRGTWWATVHRVVKSWIQLKQCSSPAHFPSSQKTPGDPISTFPRKAEDPKGMNMRTSTPEPPQSASQRAQRGWLTMHPNGGADGWLGGAPHESPECRPQCGRWWLWPSCSISELHLKTGVDTPTWQDCREESRTMPCTSQVPETQQRGAEPREEQTQSRLAGSDPGPAPEQLCALCYSASRSPRPGKG